MKRNLVVFAILSGLLSFPSLTGFAKEKAGDLPATSPRGHQPIKASVVNPDPAQYTIDVKKFANMAANEEAPTFAVYVTGKLPGTCGDFRSLELNYQKPSKYERVFNLKKHPDVLKAIDEYGCVVMRNIPPAK